MILLLALLLAQDPLAERVERLCKEAESTDVAKVARAVATLGTLGPAALPALEARAKDARGRTRDYLDFAVDEIRNGRPGPRVQLKSSDRNVIEVLNDLHLKSGAIFSIENLVDDVKLPEITVDVADASMLEALEAICRAANITVSIEGNQFALYPDNYVEKPRCFFGGFEHLLSGYSHQKVVNFRKPAVEFFSLTMLLLWNPALGQPSIRYHRVLEAVDDKGKSLVVPVEPPGADEGNVEAMMQIELHPPSNAAEKLRVVRGYTVVGVPKEILEIPLDGVEVGKTGRAGDFRVKLLKVDPANGRIEFEIASTKHKPAEIKALPLGALITVKGGDPARCQITAKDDGEHAVVVGLQYAALRVRELVIVPDEGNGAPPPERIRVVVPLQQQERRIPFEFRDVKLR